MHSTTLMMRGRGWTCSRLPWRLPADTDASPEPCCLQGGNRGKDATTYSHVMNSILQLGRRQHIPNVVSCDWLQPQMSGMSERLFIFTFWLISHDFLSVIPSARPAQQCRGDTKTMQVGSDGGKDEQVGPLSNGKDAFLWMGGKFSLS